MPWAPHPGWHDMLGRDLSWLPWHCRQHASSIAFQSTDVWPPVWKHYPAAPDILHTAEKDRMQKSQKCTLVQCDCVHVRTCGGRNVKGIYVSVCVVVSNSHLYICQTEIVRLSNGAECKSAPPRYSQSYLQYTHMHKIQPKM